MSLRLRLTALCVGLVALVLTAFAISTLLVARARIYSSFDDSLQTQANVITALLPAGSTGGELPGATRRQLETQAAAGALFQIRSAEGTVLYSSFRGSPNLLPRKSLESQSFFNGKVADQSLRLLYVPLGTTDNPGGYIEVGRPSTETTEALAEIGGTLAAGWVLALLLTVFPAYFIAGRALRPIREVSGLARRIEQTSDFSQRLRREHSAGEIAELITTFNEMISRIEHTLNSHNEFLAESSHELRRPLTNLRTNLDILRDPRLPEADRVACIERMSREALAMSALVGDLLLLTRDRSQALHRVEVDFSALCADAISRARFSYRNAAIESDVRPGLFVLGDEERLSQMLRNLLENAVSYSPPGAPVTMSVGASGDRVAVSVRDSGYGISEEDRPHVFDRFYRGQQARALHKEGVGLGLAIVKYVVEGHGGQIEVESPPAGGTTFTIELPLLRAAPAETLRPLLSAP